MTIIHRRRESVPVDPAIIHNSLVPLQSPRPPVRAQRPHLRNPMSKRSYYPMHPSHAAYTYPPIVAMDRIEPERTYDTDYL